MPPRSLLARRESVSVQDAERVTWLRIPPGEPGVIELRSPNACVTWTVEDSSQDVQRRRVFRTGPASAEAVFLPDGGTISSVKVQKTNYNLGYMAMVHGLQQTVTAGQEGPAIEARFFPGVRHEAVRNGDDRHTWWIGHADGIVINRGGLQTLETWDRLPLAAVADTAQPTRLGWVPGHARRLTLRASSEVVVELFNAAWAGVEGDLLVAGANLIHRFPAARELVIERLDPWMYFAARAFVADTCAVVTFDPGV